MVNYAGKSGVVHTEFPEVKYILESALCRSRRHSKRGAQSCVRCHKPNTSLLDIEINTFSRLRMLETRHKVCASCHDKAYEHRWKDESLVYRPRFSGQRALGKLQKTIRAFNRYTGVCDVRPRHRTFDKESE